MRTLNGICPRSRTWENKKTKEFRNDILRKHGIIPEKPPSPTPMIEEALTEARRLAHENRLEGKDLDELDELEDEEDDDFLNSYRYDYYFCVLEFALSKK
jgi:hypothetical protein